MNTSNLFRTLPSATIPLSFLSHSLGPRSKRDSPR